MGDSTKVNLDSPINPARAKRSPIRRRQALRLLAGSAICLLTAGCGPFFINQTDEVDGTISAQFVNNTSARAIFSFGTWDALNIGRTSPVNVLQQSVEANTTSAPAAITCARNFAIATDDLVERVLMSDEPNTGNVDLSLLNETIFFSAAPVGDPAEEAPTAGQAIGVELLLGVNYSCGDLIILTFEEDVFAPEGFRVDVTIVPDNNNDT